jgi:hypothetical protein
MAQRWYVPMTEFECHRLRGKPLLGEGADDACRCFLTDGGFLECPVEADCVIPVKRKPAIKPTGDSCQECGSFAMVRTGTCMTCQSCGSSSGGCS